MKYQILTICEPDIQDGMKKLEQQVNNVIKDGWMPQGGISVNKNELEPTKFSTGKKFILAQAMVKEDTK